VELAFWRHLSGQAVPFDVRERHTLQPTGSYYILVLGGHRCDVISYLISRTTQVAQLGREPTSLLQAPALLHLDEFAAEGHRSDDLYVFAFLAGKVASGQKEVKLAIATGQIIHLIRPMPEAWQRPAG
jgi:hypothetical protein